MAVKYMAAGEWARERGIVEKARGRYRKEGCEGEAVRKRTRSEKLPVRMGYRKHEDFAGEGEARRGGKKAKN
jgi:hypothetical protein